MKQMCRKLTILAIIVSVVTSCTSTYHLPLNKTYEREFIGMTSLYIQSLCGTPDRIDNDGHGGEILIYTDAERFQAHNGYIVNNKYPKQTFVYMFIGADGCCYKIQTDHFQAKKEPDAYKTVWCITGSTIGVSIAVALFTILWPGW